MQAHREEFRVRAMCRVLRVNRAGDYAWLKSPKSERAKEDERLLGLIKRQWLASGSVYGHRKITKDLRDLAERCSRHRVHRLMRAEGLRAHVGTMGANPASIAGLSTSPQPTCLIGSSMSLSRTRPGRAISPSSARMKAGCIWLW